MWRLEVGRLAINKVPPSHFRSLKCPFVAYRISEVVIYVSLTFENAFIAVFMSGAKTAVADIQVCDEVGFC